jgi:hypothetical protein
LAGRSSPGTPMPTERELIEESLERLVERAGEIAAA